MDHDDEFPAREQFFDLADWLRFCRGAGIEPTDDGRPGWTLCPGADEEAALYRATFEDSWAAYERSLEEADDAKPVSPERQDGRPCRDDFLTQGEWLRFCREAGIEPTDDGQPGLVQAFGDDEESARYRATFGHSQEAYVRAHEGYGVTRHLEWEHFKMIYEAVAVANCCGHVLNCFLTVTWSMHGVVEDQEVARCQRELFRATERWCAEWKMPPVWIWVLERGQRRGLHTHALLVIIQFLYWLFRAFLLREVERITGKPAVLKPDSQSVRADMGSEEDVARQWRTFGYFLKGMDPTIRCGGPDRDSPGKLLSVVANRAPSNEGWVFVERVGVAPGLDPESVAGWFHERGLAINLAGMNSTEELFTDGYLRWYCGDHPGRKARFFREKKSR